IAPVDNAIDGVGTATNGPRPSARLSRIESKARSPNPQRAIHTYYRDNGRGSSHADAGRDGRISVDGAQPAQKNRRKMMESRYFSGSEGIYRGSKSGACTPRSGTVICVQSNRPAGDVESISRDFDAAREATDGENSPQRSDLASPTPRRLLSRLRATETTEP